MSETKSNEQKQPIFRILMEKIQGWDIDVTIFVPVSKKNTEVVEFLKKALNRTNFYISRVSCETMVISVNTFEEIGRADVELCGVVKEFFDFPKMFQESDETDAPDWFDGFFSKTRVKDTDWERFLMTGSAEMIR